jgi:hypothetical protein
MIGRGEVKLPKFQRGFVWNQEKVLALLDSVFQGYPIGTLLFWETHERLPEENDLGGFLFPPAPDLTPRRYVFDGQQRLVSLLGSLKNLPGNTRELFPVYYDLRDKKFIHQRDGADPHLFPLYNLFDIDPFVRHVQSLQLLDDGAELVSTLQDLLRRFQSYKVSVVTIHEPDMTKVAPIFERINSTGTRLTLFDFLVAALWSPTFDFRGRVEAIRDSLEPKRYEDVDEVTVIRALSVVSLGTAKRDTLMNDMRALGEERVNSNLEKTQAALARAVDFLSTEVTVVGDEMLPYERQLVLLTYVFAGELVRDARHHRVLRQWFWRTSFSERYRRGGEGLFDEDLTAAVEALNDTDRLERFGTPPEVRTLIGAEFRVPSAFTKAFAAMLASHHPRNLRSGTPIDVVRALSPYNRREFHHIFPKSFVDKQLGGHARVNSLVNICMLAADDNKIISDSPPSRYFGELLQVHGDEFPKILASNLIPEDCISFIEKDDLHGFLETRAEYLKTHIADLYYRGN